MRITQNQFFALAFDATQRHSRDVLLAQQKISSGSKILRPSDDPTGTRRALQIESSLARVNEFIGNLDGARRFLDTAASSLTNVGDLVSSVRSAAIAGANGTLTQTDRDTFAQEIDALLDQLVGLANADFQGQFLFAGTANDSAPFRVASNGVSYFGNAESIHAAIAPGLEVVMNVTGSEVFGERTPLTPKFLGRNGIEKPVALGTSRLDAEILLEHVATTLGDGALPGGGDTASGIVPGASSAGGDSLLGSHELDVTIAADGSSGTVRLNGGPTVDFTTADTDLRLEGPDGEFLFLDFSSVTAGYSGSVDIGASGTYSLDGGTTTEVIDFASGEQSLTDPANGKTIIVDSRNVDRVGTTEVVFQGGLDLFETLAAIRDDLRNGDGLDPTALAARIGAHVEELDRHLDNVLSKISELGSRSASLDNVRSFLDQQDLTLRDSLSSVKDTDISETIIELVRAQTLLDAATSVSNQVLQNSLSSFLG